MRRIQVADLAERDLDQIWHRVATSSGNIEVANGVVDSLTESFALFASRP